MQLDEGAVEKIRKHLKRKHHIEISISSVNKPRSEVFPVMHRTGRELLNLKLDTKYVATNTGFRWNTLGFETVDIEDLLCNHKHVMLTGPAGSGKSSALKYFAKKVTAEEIPSHKDSIKLVIFLEFKHMLREGDVALRDVLLGGSVCPNITPMEKIDLLAWMTENDDKILFVIDGYDQINQPLDKDDILTPGYYDTSKEKSFIKAILSRNLFPSASILTSSREYAVQDLPGCCWPDSFITLGGLSPENINLLITEMAGDTVLRKLIKTKNYLLYSFCSNPLLLTYITSVFICNPEKTPETVTGLTAAVVYNFLTSRKHSHESTLESFRKLVNLAFFGTDKGKVVFDEQDMKNHDLKDKDIEDLLISVPPFHPLQTNTASSILEGSYKKYFCHQTIQELLSAIYVIMLPVNDFKKILETKGLHNKWDVVIRMVYGLLFQPEIPKLFEDMTSRISKTKENNEKKKQDSLRSTRSSQPIIIQQTTVHKYVGIEVSNTGDVDLRKATINFNAPETSRTTTEYFETEPTNAIGIQQRIQHNEDQGRNDVSSFEIGSLVENKQRYRDIAIQYLQDKIETVDVKMLHRLYETGKHAVSMISQNVKKIDLSLSSMENYNACVLGKILSRCRSLKWLDLNQCNLTENHIAVIVEALNVKCCSIKLVELSCNPNIVCRNLATFLSLACANELDLSNCAIDEEKFKEFVDGFANMKIPIINRLFIAENPGIVGNALAKFIVAAQVKEIGLWRCQISSEQMSDFVSEFNDAHHHIRNLNLTYNPYAFGKNLARLVSSANLDELGVSKCQVTAEKFEEFVSAFDPANFPKIRHLDISNNPGIVDGPLAKFLITAEVSNLRICNVQISANCFENFVRNLQDHKFSKIDIQTNSIPPILLPSLKRLLQHVEMNGEVWFTDNVMDGDVRRILTEASECCKKMRLRWW